MSKRYPLDGSDEPPAKRIHVTDAKLNVLKRISSLQENLYKMICSCEDAPLKKLVAEQEQKIAATSIVIGPSNSERYGFGYLGTPLKPASDKKIYRVIKLKNGLRAILISDITNVQTVIQCKDNARADSISESEAGSATGSEGESDSEGESGSEKGSSLEEGSDSEKESLASAKDVVISDSAMDIDDSRRVSDKMQGSAQVKLAAVGLTIGVGSFSDPAEIPGLAHFLEHMVFMGSQKYPAENHFDSFIKRQGGSDNANTDCETTTFYFECQEKFLREGMDKFSQFFSAPLLKKEAMTRERKAVESEFQESLSSDGARWMQLTAGMARDGHPATKFTWGNAETLKRDTTPAKLHRALHEFRRRHYSAHRFTLAVQARLPLEQLEAFVAETFSDVANNDQPSDDFSPYTDSFDTTAFRRLYRIQSARDTLKLNLTWALPPQRHLYRSKPFDFVEELLDEEGEGSLLAFLKQKLWAFSLHAEHSSTGFETNSMYFLFSICVKLTDEGYRNIDQIIVAVFGYLRLMREAGPNERYFDERRRMAEARFNYCEETEATDYVEELAEALQFYPPEDCISGPRLYFEYDPQVIKSFQDALTPDSVNVTIFSLDKSIAYDKEEKWFKTKYTDQDIPAEWLASWRTAMPPASCHLPGPNPLVPTDFTVQPEPAHHEFPVSVASTALAEVWHKRDTKFLQPVASYCFYLISPEVEKSAQEAVMLNLMADLLDFQLAGELHPARAADISVTVRPSTNGLAVYVSGFSQNLHIVLDMVFKKLATLEAGNEEVFAEIKLNRTKMYYNTFLMPYKLASDIRLDVLVSPHWTAVERLAAAAPVDRAALNDFVRRYRERLFVQCLAQGNVSREQALAAADLVQQTLRYQPLPAEQRPQYRVRQIEEGKRVVRAKSFNVTDSISFITNYYQAGLGSVYDICMLEVIMSMMEEPLFDRLRTKEQLGYDVSCAVRDTHGILGFTVSVTFQENKHVSAAVDGRIDAFLARFAATMARCSDHKLEEARHTVIKLKSCADVQLREEVNRNWAEVITGDFRFDRLQREVAMLEKVTPDDIRKWARDRLPGSEHVTQLRELSVQVVGCQSQDATDTEKKNGVANRGKKAVSADSKKDSQAKSVSGKDPSGDACSCEVEKDLKSTKSSAKETNKVDETTIAAVEKEELSCKKHPLLLLVEDKLFVDDIESYRKELVQFPYHQILE